MEFIIALAMKFWQWTVLICGNCCPNYKLYRQKSKTNLKFNFKGFPRTETL